MNKQYALNLFGEGPALKQYQRFGHSGSQLSQHCNLEDINDFTNWIVETAPDFVITGTSINDFTERKMTKVAKHHGIPCFVILDQWMNIGIRFSKFNSANIENFSSTKIEIDYVPDKVMVIDDVCRQIAIQEGLPENCLVVTGQPYFTYLNSKVTTNFSSMQTGLKIVFFSEPLSEDYPAKFWGYDEIGNVESIIATIIEIIDEGHINDAVSLTIKLHPRETKTKFDSLRNKNLPFQLIVEEAKDSFDLITESHIVIGMSSMALFESFIMGKNVLSFQPELNRPNSFQLSNMGHVETVLSAANLKPELLKMTTGKMRRSDSDFVDTDSYKQIVNVVEESLWQN